MDPTLLIVTSSVCYKARYWYNIVAALVFGSHATGKFAIAHHPTKKY